MMYRNFAVATLLAAPLIVMATQSLTPQPPSQPGQSAIQPDVAPPPVPVPVAPPVAIPGATTMIDPPSSFGKPMGGADQPALAPGAGLPDTSAPNGGMEPGFSSQSAPPGSPNAE